MHIREVTPPICFISWISHTNTQHNIFPRLPFPHLAHFWKMNGASDNDFYQSSEEINAQAGVQTKLALWWRTNDISHNDFIIHWNESMTEPGSNSEPLDCFLTLEVCQRIYE